MPGPHNALDIHDVARRNFPGMRLFDEPVPDNSEELKKLSERVEVLEKELKAIKLEQNSLIYKPTRMEMLEALGAVFPCPKKRRI